MREVNNNTTNSNSVNFTGVQPRTKDVLPEVQHSQEVTDLGKMPSEVIGRSQVAKSSLAKDVEFASKKPEEIDYLNRVCDYLVKERGLSYEQACAVIGEAAEEFYGA